MAHRPCGNGKGNTPILPKDKEQFDSNWDRIFKKPNKETSNENSDSKRPTPRVWQD